MDADIKALIANLRHAAWNKQSASIGGGVFSPEMCKKAADALERSAKLETAADRAESEFYRLCGDALPGITAGIVAEIRDALGKA